MKTLTTKWLDNVVGGDFVSQLYHALISVEGYRYIQKEVSFDRFSSCFYGNYSAAVLLTRYQCALQAAEALCSNENLAIDLLRCAGLPPHESALHCAINAVCISYLGHYSATSASHSY